MLLRKEEHMDDMVCGVVSAGSKTPDIVLHQWCISPYCTKVRKVLEFKGLPYRCEEYGGLRALKRSSLSVAGKLPVLDYGAERVQDSSAIARLLEQRHPTPSLWPEQLDVALVHLLADWADESLYWYQLWLRFAERDALDAAVAAACKGRPGYERTIFKQGMLLERGKLKAQGIGRYPRETVLAKFREHLRALEGRLTRNSWLAGELPSIADIAVAAQLDEVARTSTWVPELHALPHLSAWRARCDFKRAAATAPRADASSPLR
jgi:glutathione S-transferase